MVCNDGEWPADAFAVGIYTEQVLDSYRGKNRLEVSPELASIEILLVLIFF
jgi:hypothetical protein